MSDAPGTRLQEMLRRAGAQWDAALSASAQTPPDAGYAARVREIAKAARQQQGAFSFAAAQGKGWRSRPNARSMWLSYELRPGATSRPEPTELRERFDSAVSELGEALAGVSLYAIADAFGHLAETGYAIADHLDPGTAEDAVPPSEQTGELNSMLRLAGALWDQALSASAQTPPDAGYAARVREIAKAARQQQGAFSFAAAQGKGWRSRPNARSMWLSYELRPGATSRPEPTELRERFDSAVSELGEALAEVSLHAIVDAFGHLAEAGYAIADHLEQASRERAAQPSAASERSHLRSVKGASG